MACPVGACRDRRCGVTAREATAFREVRAVSSTAELTARTFLAPVPPATGKAWRPARPATRPPCLQRSLGRQAAPTLRTPAERRPRPVPLPSPPSQQPCPRQHNSYLSGGVCSDSGPLSLLVLPVRLLCCVCCCLVRLPLLLWRVARGGSGGGDLAGTALPTGRCRGTHRRLPVAAWHGHKGRCPKNRPARARVGPLYDTQTMSPTTPVMALHDTEASWLSVFTCGVARGCWACRDGKARAESSRGSGSNNATAAPRQDDSTGAAHARHDATRARTHPPCLFEGLEVVKECAARRRKGGGPRRDSGHVRATLPHSVQGTGVAAWAWALPQLRPQAWGVVSPSHLSSHPAWQRHAPPLRLHPKSPLWPWRCAWPRRLIPHFGGPLCKQEMHDHEWSCRQYAPSTVHGSPAMLHGPTPSPPPFHEGQGGLTCSGTFPAPLSPGWTELGPGPSSLSSILKASRVWKQGGRGTDQAPQPVFPCPMQQVSGAAGMQAKQHAVPRPSDSPMGTRLHGHMSTVKFPSKLL